MSHPIPIHIQSKSKVQSLASKLWPACDVSFEPRRVSIVDIISKQPPQNEVHSDRDRFNTRRGWQCVLQMGQCPPSSLIRKDCRIRARLSGMSMYAIPIVYCISSLFVALTKVEGTRGTKCSTSRCSIDFSFVHQSHFIYAFNISLYHLRSPITAPSILINSHWRINLHSQQTRPTRQHVVSSTRVATPNPTPRSIWIHL